MPSDRVVDKEMGISRADFLRLLPGALGSGIITMDGSSAVFEDGERRIEVSFEEMPERRIANLRLPVLRVSLKFSGFAEDRLKEALARFERAFARTGG